MSIFYQDEYVTIIHDDCRTALDMYDFGHVQCCVTSPPYFGLRRYTDNPTELGLEETPAAYVAALTGVFEEVRRVLRQDGVMFLNLGDSYAGVRGNSSDKPGFDNKAAAGGATFNHKGAGVPKSTRMRLRSDLTPEQVAYVLEELAKHSRMESATVAGDE